MLELGCLVLLRVSVDLPLKLVVTKVPLRYAKSKVEIDVTVTVDSDVEDALRVLFPEDSEEKDPDGLSELPLDVESEGSGVGGGVVMTDWESVKTDPTTLVTSLAAGTVSDPKSDSDTTVPADTAGIVVAAEVAVPSPTLI